MSQFEFLIEKTWNDQNIDHNPVKIILKNDETKPDTLLIQIAAPFFNSPRKPEKPIGEFFNLWDYEVVEVFFLADNGKYLELEFGPYGHYVALLVQGPGKKFLKEGLELDFKANINGNKWTGEVRVPETYFPRNVTKINAYCIHGEENDRKYEALYPVPFQRYSQPDFHRLDYFKAIDFGSILPVNSTQDESHIWKQFD